MRAELQSLLVLALLAGGPVLAADVPAARMQACASQPNHVLRLICFDALVTPVEGVPRAGAAVVGSGKWQLREDVDSMTSQVRILATLESENAVADRFGRTNHASMGVACRNSKTDVLVNIKDFVSVDDVQVMTRIDDKPPVTRAWSVSTDHRFVLSKDAIALAKELEGASRFQLRVTPHGESPRTFEFDITGLAVPLTSIRASCGW